MWLRRLFGPDNALIISSDQAGEPLEEQILEIRRYYSLVKLGDIVERLTHGKTVSGLAAVAIQNPRRELFQKTLPFFLGEKIPFTLFLRPDCIGVNRLPAEEELEVYFDTYPEKLAGHRLDEWREKAWREPEAAESFLLACRREVGPLPLDRLDPGRFFTTWGKIFEIPPALRELGLYAHSGSAPALLEASAFLGRQIDGPVSVAFAPRQEELVNLLGPLGIRGCLSSVKGAVTGDTDPWKLPSWHFEEAP